MFDNSMVALMIMLLLCFVGMLVMFLFVIRSNIVLSDSVKELLNQQQLALGDIERHLMYISFKVRDKNELIEEIQNSEIEDPEIEDEENDLLSLISPVSDLSFSTMKSKISLSSPQATSQQANRPQVNSSQANRQQNSSQVNSPQVNSPQVNSRQVNSPQANRQQNNNSQNIGSQNSRSQNSSPQNSRSQNSSPQNSRSQNSRSQNSCSDLSEGLPDLSLSNDPRVR